MNAKEAATTSNRRKAQIERSEQTRKKREAATAEKKAQVEARRQFPSTMRDVRKEIAEAVNHGRRSITYRSSRGRTSGIVLEKLRKKLEAEGYGVGFTQYHSDDVNYGDFNAPCTVHEEWSTTEISW